MHRTRNTLALATLATLALGGSPISSGEAQGGPWGIHRDRFAETIERVVSMPGDADLQQRVAARGLNVVNVMWEDTGRFQGSSIGPNISDLTLQVRETVAGGGVRTHLLPVIRHPNFSDRTADVPARNVWVRVGNQREGGRLEAVPLTEVLAHLGSYLSSPESLLGSGNLLAERDTHFLVSAQHVYVPLESEGRAEFNPVIFNYQSAPGSPAVLTLLATRQGTSITVVENRPGDQSFQGWGEQLYFNHGGQRTVFTAERRSAVAARIEAGNATAQDEGALEEGADMMLLVQVPLRHRNAGYLSGLVDEESATYGAGGGMPSASAPMARRSRSSDVEAAVIGHGEDLGPFYEAGGLRLVRDERFPVRITVQFYRATSNGVISDEDLEAVHRSIERVYSDGDFVGSLVVPDGDRTRPTEWRHIRRRNQG